MPICEKIEKSLDDIDLGISRLDDYQHDLSDADLNRMSALASKLQKLVFAVILEKGKQ